MGNDADGNPMYRVGGTTIDAAVGTHSRTVDDQTTITGLMKSMNPKHMVDMIDGDVAVVAVAADPDNVDAAVVVGVAHVQAVAARTVEIGKVIDSADDMARLMLVDSYAGSKMVNVYVAETGGTNLTGSVGADGRIDITPNDAEDDMFVTLKSVGTYYIATEGQPGDQAGELDSTDLVAADAETKHVYSYVDDDGETVYVVLESTTTGDTTTVIYNHVDVEVMIDGDDVQVRAELAEATEYKHINFGVWAGLGEAEKNGTQAIAGLGIGFVDSIGDGMTEVMPNAGTAKYNGDWVGTVQVEDDDGDGMTKSGHGAATLTANFENGDFTALLAGLATLEGAITGNTFTGVSASDITHGDLDADADFTGEFNGAFFGSKAAEAGGVFAFATEDNEGGAFTGAFGGDKD